MTTQSFRCKTCAHIHTTVSEVIKKAYIQSFRTISENQCLLQMLNVMEIRRRYIIKAFKDSNRYEHVRLKISVWQSQSERRSQSSWLKKALYGLKQAPRAWYDKLSSFLIEHHLTKGIVDTTLFTGHHGGDILLVQVYKSPRNIFVSQSQYAIELLKKHGMDECDSMSTPMATARLDTDL
ncbi:retrovirus-related pol polyprotein from transposon TNT 1-94 [Tanacetum coccineum]